MIVFKTLPPKVTKYVVIWVLIDDTSIQKCIHSRSSYFPMAYYCLGNESIGNGSIKTHIALPFTWSLDGIYKNWLFHKYTMIYNTNINAVKHSKYAYE